MKINYKKAFTLVELSIVLVIIGLLTAGVVGGQSLIKSAEINSITTDVTKYQTALNAFRLEYDAIAGDMKNATDYWGQVAANCTTAAGTGTQTCNGDGDGLIEGYEGFRAWQQLVNAGIIQGNYTGVAGSGGYGSCGWGHHVIGTNSPESKRKKVGYALNSFPYNAALTWIFTGPYDNILTIGGELTNCEPITGAFTPKEMKKIDDKIDDGKPGTGNVLMRPSTPCLSTGVSYSNPSAATYNLSSTGLDCFIYVREYIK